MEFASQTGRTDVSDSGNVESPQLPTPVQIAQPEADGSFFAEWFKVVDPNGPVMEDQDFGRSGWALEPDNFADERELENYLKSDHMLAEDQSSDPFNLALEGFDSASDSESSTAEDVESEKGLLDPVAMMPLESDWEKMPPVLPALPGEEPTLEVLDLEPKMSDWSQMPDLLPPLPLEASLSVPELSHQTSTTDYVFVDHQVAQPQVQNGWNTGNLVDVEHLHESVVPYYGQTVPTTAYGAQASGLFTGQHTGQMVPLYETPPVFHLPFIVLGSTQLSFV
jgi:hypothetical protein